MKNVAVVLINGVDNHLNEFLLLGKHILEYVMDECESFFDEVVYIDSFDAREIKKEAKHNSVYVLSGSQLIVSNFSLKSEGVTIFNHNPLCEKAVKEIGITPNNIDTEKVLDLNDPINLTKTIERLKKQNVERLMKKGVYIEDPNTTYISDKVKIKKGTKILHNTTIYGESRIGFANTIGPNVYLDSVSISENNIIENSHIEDSTIGSFNKIGPYARLRDGVIVKDNVYIGNFVELKKCLIGYGVRVSHLSYLGDADVGTNTNIGCMTVTANYDGYNKNQTDIGSNVFVGSGSILVAPVKIDGNAFIAAGSVITKDVKKGQLAIERSEQINIKGGAKKVLDKAREKQEDADYW